MSLTVARTTLQNLKQKFDLSSVNERDEKLGTIVTENPRASFSLIKSTKNSNTSINKLVVGENTFTGARVAAGFHQSISAMEKSDSEKLKSNTLLCS